MKRPKLSLKIWLTALVAILLIIGVVLRFAPHPSMAKFHEMLDAVLHWAGEKPFWIFILLVGLLPLAGVPASALYVLAGAIYAPRIGLFHTVAGILLGLVLNLCVSYFLAHHFRDRVRKIVAKAGVKFPSLQGKSAWKVVLLIRIMPGAPLMVQNLFLGLAHTPFFVYLGVSLIAEFLITLAYITLGNSVSQGHTAQLLGAISIFVVAILVISLLRERLNKKNE